jgi:NADPH2:quinone reductase
MAHTIRLYEAGGPDVLRYETVDVGEPGPGEVRIRQEAVALNYADTYFRDGTYPIPLPSGLGVEAAGVVASVGPGVQGLAVGDRVSYTGFLNTLGAYCTERILPAALLIKLPAGLSCELAAAITTRGLTAAYLLRRLHSFQPGDTILLHAAAGGLGLIMGQWAQLLGLRVIGTVSSAVKAELARAHGCAQVIDYSREDVAQRVAEMTDGQGVSVVFDSVGRTTFEASLNSLRRRGLMVCVGTTSGTVAPLDPQTLARKGSLFITRPALADYIHDPAEKAALAQELFDHVLAGRIRVDIHQRYALQDAAQAHRDLEARKTLGASIFTIA